MPAFSPKEPPRHSTITGTSCNSGQISLLQEPIRSLHKAITGRNEAEIDRARRSLGSRIRRVIPSKPHAVWAENIEAIVVAVALAGRFSGRIF